MLSKWLTSYRIKTFKSFHSLATTYMYMTCIARGTCNTWANFCNAEYCTYFLRKSRNKLKISRKSKLKQLLKCREKNQKFLIFIQLNSMLATFSEKYWIWKICTTMETIFWCNLCHQIFLYIYLYKYIFFCFYFITFA